MLSIHGFLRTDFLPGPVFHDLPLGSYSCAGLRTEMICLRTVMSARRGTAQGNPLINGNIHFKVRLSCLDTTVYPLPNKSQNKIRNKANPCVKNKANVPSPV
jgi:hypothetical protein